MANRLPILFSVVLVGAGLWAFYTLATLASRGGEQSPLYSTFRHDPYGTAALYALLEKRGLDVVTLERPRIDADRRGVLIQVLPAPKSEETTATTPNVHTQSLVEWIEAGNTVVQFTSTTTELMQACDIAFVERGSAAIWDEQEQQMRRGMTPDALKLASFDAHWTEDGERLFGVSGNPPEPLFVLSPARLPDAHGDRWRVLAATHLHPVAGAQRVGNGRLIVVGSTAPALNHWLGEGGNLDFLLALVGDQPVTIDAWSLGIGHGGTIMGIIREIGLLPVLAQLIIALAIYVWSTMGHKRPDVQPPPRRRASTEQIITLGHLYSQTLSDADLSQRTRVEVTRRVASALRCGMTDIARRAAAHGATIQRRAADLLNAADELVQLNDRRRIEQGSARLLELSHQFEKELSRDRRKR